MRDWTTGKDREELMAVVQRTSLGSDASCVELAHYAFDAIPQLLARIAELEAMLGPLPPVDREMVRTSREQIARGEYEDIEVILRRLATEEVTERADRLKEELRTANARLGWMEPAYRELADQVGLPPSDHID